MDFMNGFSLMPLTMLLNESFYRFQISLQAPLIMRVSYNDYKLYLSILESVSKQLNRAIKSEVSSNPKDEIPDHNFDGERNVV